MISALPRVGRLAAEDGGRAAVTAEHLVHQRELDLAEALAAEFGAEVAGPQALVLHLLLQRLDRASGDRVGLVVRVAEHEVERLDLLAHELVDPVELFLELRIGLEIPRHGGLQSVEVIRARGSDTNTAVSHHQPRVLPSPRGRPRIERSRCVGQLARRLFAEQGIEAVSLREWPVPPAIATPTRCSTTSVIGSRCSSRSEPFEHDVGERRTALVDMLATEPAPSMRSIAGALVRPSAAMLETHDGRDHLRIVAELIIDMDGFTAALGTADNSLGHWDRVARANMADTTLPSTVDTRHLALLTELGRRATSRRRPDHRLFVSDLIDLVAGVLQADVSEETQRLLDRTGSTA